MLGLHAHADQMRADPLQPGKTLDHAHRQRQARARVLRERGCDDLVLDGALEELRHARRPHAARVHLRQQAERRRTLAQRGRENVRRSQSTSITAPNDSTGRPALARVTEWRPSAPTTRSACTSISPDGVRARTPVTRLAASITSSASAFISKWKAGNAQEVGVFLQHHDLDAHACEQQSEHHARRPAADDATTRGDPHASGGAFLHVALCGNDPIGKFRLLTGSRVRRSPHPAHIGREGRSAPSRTPRKGGAFAGRDRERVEA
jgi:hypothetical protein